MIQRIQSIFLLLAAACMSLLFTEPMSFVTIFGDATALKAADQSMLDDGVFEVTDHTILLFLVAACIILPLVILLLFKNRTLQLKLGRITITLVVVLFALTVILFWQDYNLMVEGTEISIEYGYLLPIASVVLMALAMRYIKKDERLVRSSDRLR